MRFSSWLGKVKSLLEARSTNLARKRRTTRSRINPPRLEFLEDRTLPSTYGVTTTADFGPGPCAMRSPRQTRNRRAPSPSTSSQAIPVTTLRPAAGPSSRAPAPPRALPAITSPVTIDATTQLGFAGVPVVVLDGSQAGSSASGLVLTASAAGSTLQGLVIDNFSGNGIEIDGGGNNVIATNYIGVDATGKRAAGNGRNGIALTNTSDNTIGGTTATGAQRHQRQPGRAVQLTGSGTTGNVVEGNYIGTDASGSLAVPKLGSNGVEVVSINDGASDNVIGGSVPGSGNVISGNKVGSDGVDISGSGTDYNRVQGNFIGVDQSGNVALGNGGFGVRILNGAQFNVIGVDSTNNVADGNVISGNAVGGVAITGSDDNVVAGNLIGLGADGSTTVGNGPDGGVGIWADASGNIIGGTTAADRNVISGNSGVGIVIGNDDGTSGNVIEGNYIGTDATGLLARPNVSPYQFIALGAACGLKEPAPTRSVAPRQEPRNVISGNYGVGVFLSTGTTGVQIQGNYIGVDADRHWVLANTGVGIQIGSLFAAFRRRLLRTIPSVGLRLGPATKLLTTMGRGGRCDGHQLHGEQHRRQLHLQQHAHRHRPWRHHVRRQ